MRVRVCTRSIEQHEPYLICLIHTDSHSQGEGAVVPLVKPTVEYELTLRCSILSFLVFLSSRYRGLILGFRYKRALPFHSQGFRIDCINPLPLIESNLFISTYAVSIAYLKTLFYHDFVPI